ncbi:hypothetical protein FNV43_RR26884 [Rhamnella rubrinervis]|uniref:Uncharacterized protein n=1 Tax=Rhamnella rubrinervis TaxID=2594499 RepID=A0A8K0GRZ6_9ROSA|nr:hypothetical protein FNV43_RR26884 [Rhamnella rubrinervis]
MATEPSKTPIWVLCKAYGKESEDEDSQKEKKDDKEEGLVVDGKEQALDREGKVTEDTKEEGVLVEKVDRDSVETLENEGGELSKKRKKTNKIKWSLQSSDRRALKNTVG